MSIIKVRDLRVKFGDRVVLKGIDITVDKGDIYAILGKSGSGKTTLLRSILMLEKFSGTIEVFGVNLNRAREEEKQAIRNRYGVMFQAASLFTSLTVGENILASIRERVKLSKNLLDEFVSFKLRLVGLESWVSNLYPYELSGGMRKKAALARALALDPEIIFLDEPTSGLDPVSADDFDNTIRKLNELLGITVVMITHDLDSLFNIAKRACVIREGKVLAEGKPSDIMDIEDDWLKKMFNGLRGRKYQWSQR
ncbi:ABC transporter ATP-binding protein [Hippea alviniae]|uniref:ABC transporter ATP-binding protein n=1 Tax=Hippea alviniae TaxID=1279027 RepID=UPI0003B522CC|nr:ATP-binding cassette domain-containing protein [Hippea alviniae]